MVEYKDKIVRIFNKFFSSFLRDCKEVNDELRGLVKASYKAVDKSSSEYVEFFIKEVSEDGFEKLIKKDRDYMKDKQVAIGITFGMLPENMMNYVYLMALFAYMVGLENEDTLLAQVVKILGTIQSGGDVSDGEFDDILDDDIKDYLKIIKSYGVSNKIDIANTNSAGGPDVGPESFLGAIGNSKIANIAKEISSEIDIGSLKTDSPDDMLKSMLDFSSSNNVLGNIIQKVSTTLNSKISSGELKHEELLGEAMSMMNMFGNGGNNPLANNPLFSQMMKSMKTGKASVRQDVIKKGDARDRLRKKLEMRKKNVDNN